MTIHTTDVLIIGAGAAGLMCAIEAGKRQRRVIVIDHADRVGKKILISGGGRCNFTNYTIHPEKYISDNPHFCKSALSRYTQWDFIDLVQRHQIPFHEKTLGQLFCDGRASDIVNLLLAECDQAGVEIHLKTTIEQVEQRGDQRFVVTTTTGTYHSQSVVVACGGLSMPTLGASPLGYQIAEHFGLPVRAPRAGLVPLTLHKEDKERLASLAGIAVESVVSHDRTQFREGLLFTHRGLSGPAVLQISSYWQPGETITVNLLPDVNLPEILRSQQQQHPTMKLKTLLGDHLPKRVVTMVVDPALAEQPLHSIAIKRWQHLAAQLQQWAIKPNGTEGYRTAEVTVGGIDCNALSSQTMEAKTVPGLYCVGEVVDVTGWLGGYNFQWAWSSGWAAGQVA